MKKENITVNDNNKDFDVKNIATEYNSSESKEFFELCSNPALTISLETHTKFDSSYNDENSSPLDLFIENTKKLNMLRLQKYSDVLGNLLLLGYVSAAESYIRSIIRHLINEDEFIQTIIADKTVSYAAAQYHKKELLPEALLEDLSLASPYNVFETLKDIIGMKGQRPAEMLACSKEFMKVCELRHCCVHRFGKLGSKNAIRLGLSEHSPHLEKPILLTEEDMENIAFVVESFIRTLNNTLFKFIMHRTADNNNKEKNGEKIYSVDWDWDYDSDIGRFKKYYDIFSTKNDSAPNLSLDESYGLFLNAYKPKQNFPARKKKEEK